MMSRAVHDWSLHRTLGGFVSTEANPPGATGGMQPREGMPQPWISLTSRASSPPADMTWCSCATSIFRVETLPTSTSCVRHWPTRTSTSMRADGFAVESICRVLRERTRDLTALECSRTVGFMHSSAIAQDWGSASPAVLAAMSRSLSAEAEVLTALPSHIDLGALNEAVVRLSRASLVVTCASGSSGYAAAKFAHSLCCVERAAKFMPPSDAIHGGMGCIHAGDAVVMLSPTSATPSWTREPRCGATPMTRMHRPPDPWVRLTQAP